MARNKVQFQKGLSEAQFAVLYGTEDQCREAVMRVLSRSVLEFDWHGLRLGEDTWSGSKVNRLIDEFLGEALPSIDFAHGDLT